MAQSLPNNLFTSKTSAREAAYLALMAVEQNFIRDSLQTWRQEAHPSVVDFYFARQLAYGTVQRALTLDYVAQQLSTQGTLSLKRKERLLLRIALYQALFLDRVPLYAIADEMGKLAKRYCHVRFARFLNALLRQLSHRSTTIPEGDDPETLSITYSYPRFFIEELLKVQGLVSAREILAVGNRSAPLFARQRPGVSFLLPGMQLFCTDPCVMVQIEDPVHLEGAAASSHYYIQNVTPATLVAQLAQRTPTPQRILDLCAAPGGKLLAAHDLFPTATLHANELSESRLPRLMENCQKYGLSVTVRCGSGESFPDTESFDLVIVDAPCSNSGVLYKRPEARWRLTEKAVAEHVALQQRLLQRAAQLIHPEGAIWYLTCSILPQENQQLIQSICSIGLKPVWQQLYLPDAEGRDGGYSCLLRHHSK